MLIPTIAISALFAVTVVATLVIIITRQQPYIKGEVIRIREFAMTGVMGVLLWVLGGMILYYAFQGENSLMGSMNSTINTFIFLILAIFLGSYTILYSFVKTIVIGAESITYTNVLGVPKTLIWNDIIETAVVPGKRLKITTEKDSLTIGGNRKQVQEFVDLANIYLPQGVAIDLFFAEKRKL